MIAVSLGLGLRLPVWATEDNRLTWTGDTAGPVYSKWARFNARVLKPYCYMVYEYCHAIIEARAARKTIETGAPPELAIAAAVDLTTEETGPDTDRKNLKQVMPQILELLEELEPAQ